jgi:hypothetical protein
VGCGGGAEVSQQAKALGSVGWGAGHQG